jgi:signal peptidase I
MHIMKYYIKRCVGIPGDTLEIQNGFYQVRGWTEPLGYVASQQKVSQREKESFESGVYNTFPFDSITGWTIKDFGPLYIPKKGDVLSLNRTHYLLYKNLIEWEQKTTLTCTDSIVFMDNQAISTYQFQKNYYFVAGDYTEDSRDSRYWGLLPEEYIAGKAAFIWKSVDPYTRKFRWERFLKAVK